MIGRQGILVIAGLIAVGLAACDGDRFDEYSQRDRTRGPQAGEQHPEYAAVSLDEDTIRLSDYRGEALLVNFWATWCKPCVAEFPDLIALKEELEPRGLRFLGVSLDTRPTEEVQAFLYRHGVTWLNVIDRSNRVDAAFGWENGIPKTLLIDRQGRTVVWWWGQLDTSSERNRAYLERALVSDGE